MPVLTTKVIPNILTGDSRRITQFIVQFVNNSSFTGYAYLEGFSLDGGRVLFAQETLTIPPNDVITQYYPSYFDFPQFIVFNSLDLLNVQCFAVEQDGTYVDLPLAIVEYNRITSEYRDNISLTSAEFAAISFRRRPTFELPEPFGAALFPQGIEIISSLPVRYKIMLGGVIDGSFQYYPTPNTPIPLNETALQVNFTCTTLTGGQAIFEGQTSGISTAYMNSFVSFNRSQLANIPEELPVTIVVSAMEGDDNIFVTFRISEEW